MEIILRGLTALLAVIPLVMYLVYSLRRLGTRRALLLQTLLTLGLDDAYMRIRHGEYYANWCLLGYDARIKELESKYFNPDFKAETSHSDYVWPVALITILSALGWFIALGRFDPDAGLKELSAKAPTMFLWGFVGAYFASLISIIDDFRMYSLLPGSFYSLSYRLLFSSTAALLVGQLPIFEKEVGQPLVAFGIGLIPVEKTWAFITEKASQKVGIGQAEGELGADLAAIQGLEDRRSRKKLVDIGITSVQALATADPLLLFFQTTFPMRSVVDMIDKAILYLYIGDKTKELRTHGINGVIELRALAKLAEKTPAYLGGAAAAEDKELGAFFGGVSSEALIVSVATVLGQTVDELKAFIYNLYYDPVVVFIYDVWGRYLETRKLDERTDPPNRLVKKLNDQPPDQPLVQLPKQAPDKPAEQSADERPSQPPYKPAEQSADQLPKQPADKPAEQSADQLPKQPADKPAEQSADGLTRQPTDELAERSADKLTNQPPDVLTDQPADNEPAQPGGRPR